MFNILDIVLIRFEFLHITLAFHIFPTVPHENTVTNIISFVMLRENISMSDIFLILFGKNID
jgi:hypothetical protein